jgi:AraC-like DNA-binding protein
LNKEIFFKDEKLPFIECRYTTNSGKHYKLHMHKSFSIGAISAGEVLYSVAKQKALLQKNSLAIINPNTLHSCNPMQKKQRSYYMLYLDTSWCQKVQASLFETEEFLLQKEILLEDENIYNEYIQTMDFFMNEKSFLLEKEQMMVELLESIFLKLHPSEKEDKPSLHVRKLQELLSSNIEEDLTLESLSQRLHVNPYTLLRNFKAELGITPHAFRMNYRIESAKKLLQQGLSLAQVALSCGFFDQSHFHKQFKLITTVTPKQYQLNFLQ